uniref:Uncharacterized protein n=1 Tax=Anopheles epiroticus TaxID=199890 RepID=A0A182PG98_9DIPT
MPLFESILAIVRVGSVPAPSDIISGREFLSLLMKPTVGTSSVTVPAAGGGAATHTQQSRPFRGLRKFRHFFFDQAPGAGDGDDTILPIEALFTSQEDLDRSSTRFYGYRRGGSGRTSSPSSTTPASTSVSEADDEPLTTAAPSWLVDGEPTTPPPTDGTELPTTVEEETSTIPAGPVVEEERVTAVPPVVRPSARKRAKAIQQPVESAARHSNAHRSELSVEELGPTISKEEEPDSAKGESSAVAKLVAPPAAQRYRTQRKQESAGRQPFQTVSYQLGGEKAQLKSVRDKAVPATYSEPARFYSEPAQFYSEPAKVYSEPAKVYGEPERVYSEPARVYSEPAKVYSEPARVYSEPAKVYSEPAKIYSQPSSYWQTAYSPQHDPTTSTVASPTLAAPSTTMTTTGSTVASSTVSPPSTSSAGPVRLVFNELDKIPYDQLNAPTVDGEEGGGGSIHNAIGKFVPKQPQAHGPERPATGEDEFVGQPPAGPVAVQTLAPVLGGTGDDSKVGYVVEGRNYRKYRVEEKTPDGFIVGEYGVLSHNDGNLRGVRYTADSDINPRLIYDALLKFLSL